MRDGQQRRCGATPPASFVSKVMQAPESEHPALRAGCSVSLRVVCR